MNALKADPKTVDLRAQAAHFYSIGARMLELFEEEEMVDILSDVWDPSSITNMRMDTDLATLDIQATCSGNRRSSAQHEKRFW